MVDVRGYVTAGGGGGDRAAPVRRRDPASLHQPDGGRRPRGGAREREKDTKLAQMLGQLQPSIAVYPYECMGQLASCGTT